MPFCSTFYLFNKQLSFLFSLGLIVYVFIFMFSSYFYPSFTWSILYTRNSSSEKMAKGFFPLNNGIGNSLVDPMASIGIFTAGVYVLLMAMYVMWCVNCWRVEEWPYQVSEEEIKLKFHWRQRKERDKYLVSERNTARPGRGVGFSLKNYESGREFRGDSNFQSMPYRVWLDSRRSGYCMCSKVLWYHSVSNNSSAAEHEHSLWAKKKKKKIQS